MLYFWLVVPLALIRLHPVYFVWYPKRMKTDTPERAQTAKKRLKRIVSTPSLVGGGVKTTARLRLAQLHLLAREYEPAAEQYRLILDMLMKDRRIKAAGWNLEANVHSQFADCLEGLDDHYGAQIERERAAQCLTSKDADAPSLLASGKLLAQTGHYADACENYARALHLISKHDIDLRAEVLVLMALASFGAGRTDQTIEAAEEAIAYNPKPAMRILAHSMAGIGYATQGDIASAERHRITALDLATSSGNKEQVAQALSQLANIERKRGNLQEAIDLARKAGAMTAGSKRQSDMVEAECHRRRGDYPAARASMRAVQQGKPYSTPSAERRSQGISLIGCGWIEIEAGEPQAALDYLQQAAALFPQDVRLSLWCQGGIACAFVMLGQIAPMQQTIQGVEAKLPEFANDRETQMRVATMYARVAFVQADYARSRMHWHACLALMPDPVEQPKIWYNIGECHFQQQDWSRAQEAFDRSVNFGFDTHYVRKSQQRLAEMQQMQQSAL